jgi:hypothetical protein
MPDPLDEKHNSQVDADYFTEYPGIHPFCIIIRKTHVFLGSIIPVSELSFDTHRGDPTDQLILREEINDQCRKHKYQIGSH